MRQRQKLHSQRGAISIIGIAIMSIGFTGFYTALELGNKMIMDRNFDNYAQAIAPVALRTEMSLTREMVANGQGDLVREKLSDMLKGLGHQVDSNVNLTVKFGNMVPLDSPVTYTDPSSGMEYTYHEEFEPLEHNAENPKFGLAEDEMPPDFSAVSIEIKESSATSLLPFFRPTGRAVYGLSASDIDSPDMASCYCDARYNACLVAEETQSVMGAPNSGDRKRYCETGIAPSVGGGMMGMFFGGDAEYYQADTVQFSPQWVAKSYEGMNPTDKTSQAWQAVLDDEPLTINDGVNPFPEAHWNAADAQWVAGNAPMQFTGRKKVSSFMMTYPKYKNPWELDGDTFYVGRSGVCAYPNKGFFGGFMNVIQDFMFGNTDCIRYSADPDLKYDFASPVKGFMDAINGSTGANEHYYSCRDFSGLQSSRNGFFQVMRRIWTSPLLDWERSYQEADCTVKKMHWHGWWVFGEWREA